MHIEFLFHQHRVMPINFPQLKVSKVYLNMQLDTMHSLWHKAVMLKLNLWSLVVVDPNSPDQPAKDKVPATRNLSLKDGDEKVCWQYIGSISTNFLWQFCYRFTELNNRIQNSSYRPILLILFLEFAIQQIFQKCKEGNIFHLISKCKRNDFMFSRWPSTFRK